MKSIERVLISFENFTNAANASDRERWQSEFRKELRSAVINDDFIPTEEQNMLWKSKIHDDMYWNFIDSLVMKNKERIH